MIQILENYCYACCGWLFLPETLSYKTIHTSSSDDEDEEEILYKTPVDSSSTDEDEDDEWQIVNRV